MNHLYYSVKNNINVVYHILDFNLYQKDDNDEKAELLNDNKMHHCFGIFDRDNKDLELTRDFQIHFIEMPKFQAQMQNASELKLKGWIDFFAPQGCDEVHRHKEVLADELHRKKIA